MLTYSLYGFNRELNNQIQKPLQHQRHSFVSSDPAWAGWMESISISSFVYSLEARKIFLEVWTRNLLTPRDFSSWMHPLAALPVMQKLGGTSSPSFCSPGSYVSGEAVIWLHKMRKRFETLKPSFTEFSVTAELKHAFKSRQEIIQGVLLRVFLLLVHLHIPALSTLAPAECLNPAYRHSGI